MGSGNSRHIMDSSSSIYNSTSISNDPPLSIQASRRNSVKKGPANVSSISAQKRSSIDSRSTAPPNNAHTSSIINPMENTPMGITTTFPPPLTSFEKQQIDDIISLLVENNAENLKAFLDASNKQGADRFSWEDNNYKHTTDTQRTFQSPSKMGFTKRMHYSPDFNIPSDITNSKSSLPPSTNELLLPNKEQRSIWHFIAIVWNYIAPSTIKVLFEWTHSQFSKETCTFDWLSILLCTPDIFGYTPMHIIFFHYKSIENVECLFQLLQQYNILNDETFLMGVRAYATPIGEPYLSRYFLNRMRRWENERQSSEKSQEIDLAMNLNSDISQLDISEIPAVENTFAYKSDVLTNAQLSRISKKLEEESAIIEHDLGMLEESKSYALPYLQREIKRNFTFKWESKRFGGQRVAERSMFIEKYKFLHSLMKGYLNLFNSNASKKKLQKYLSTKNLPSNLNFTIISSIFEMLDCFLLSFYEIPLYIAVFLDDAKTVHEILEQWQSIRMEPENLKTSDFTNHAFHRCNIHPRVVVEAIALTHMTGNRDIQRILLNTYKSLTQILLGSNHIASQIQNASKTQISLNDLSNVNDTQLQYNTQIPFQATANSSSVNTSQFTQTTQDLLGIELAIKEELMLVHELFRSSINYEEDAFSKLYLEPVTIIFDSVIYPKDNRFSTTADIINNQIVIPIKNPLDLASMYGFKSVVETALAHGIVPDENHLILSLASDHADLTKYLIIEEGVTPGNQLLLLTCMINTVEIARECLKVFRASYPHVYTALKHRSTDVLDVLVKEEALLPELIAASIELGSISFIERYFKPGMNMYSLRHYDASIDIQRALQLRYNTIAEYLFLQDKRLNNKHHEHLVICSSIHYENFEALRKFLSHLLFDTKKYEKQRFEKLSEAIHNNIVDEDEEIDDGYSSEWLEDIDPLYMCTVRGQVISLRMIMEHPTHIESTSNMFRDNFSILHYAAHFGHHQIIQYLLENLFPKCKNVKSLLSQESCERLNIDPELEVKTFLKEFLVTTKFYGKTVIEEVHLQRFLKEYFVTYLQDEDM